MEWPAVERVWAPAWLERPGRRPGPARRAGAHGDLDTSTCAWSPESRATRGRVRSAAAPSGVPPLPCSPCLPARAPGPTCPGSRPGGGRATSSTRCLDPRAARQVREVLEEAVAAEGRSTSTRSPSRSPRRSSSAGSTPHARAASWRSCRADLVPDPREPLRLATRDLTGPLGSTSGHVVGRRGTDDRARQPAGDRQRHGGPLRAAAAGWRGQSCCVRRWPSSAGGA